MKRPVIVQSNGRSLNSLWRVAQVLVLTATVALLAGLFLTPDPALTILWSVLIPLVPASLLISPAIWRNVCPLATLNMFPRGFGTSTTGPQFVARTGAIGILLLGVLVPARRFLFNNEGAALAVTIIAIAIAALVLGLRYDAKAGFCNAFCPILPVERLYGHNPLLAVHNPRCEPCNFCTTRACIDLSPMKSVCQTLGRARLTYAWLLTPFGTFAAAFPGFVIGYYTSADGPLNSGGAVYLHITIWVAISFAATAIVVAVLNASAGRALPVLSAAAAGLYYWFVSPLVAEALGGAVLLTNLLRLGAFALVATWLFRAACRKARHPRLMVLRDMS